MKKKQKIRSSRFAIFALALVLPLCSSGLAYSLIPESSANAATVASYSAGYIEEVSVSNNNFSSSSSSYSLSKTLTGWTGQNSSSKATSGTISTGSTFNSYMSSTFYLTSNPGTASSDNYVLMINSASSSSDEYTQERQGYKSSSITLDANSFYSFQVSFKSDATYSEDTDYERIATTTDDTAYVTSTNFTSVPFSTTEETQYVATGIGNTTYYVEKSIETDNSAIEVGSYTTTQHTYETDDVDYIQDLDVFYTTTNDETYIGVKYNDEYVFVKQSDIYDPTDSDSKVDVRVGATIYTCTGISYNSSSSNYKIAQNVYYYSQVNTYTALTASTNGSIYLSGLEDADGNEIETNFELVSSSEWTTFYFYVATGDTEQTVALELWLGSRSTSTSGATSEGGVVFFDNVHVYQYSENMFWKEYQNNYGKSYNQTYTIGNTTKTETTDVVKFVNLQEENASIIDTIDFEDVGTTNTDTYFNNRWTKSGEGSAKIFNTSSAAYFKTSTGFDYVGSNLGVTDLSTDNGISYSENKYLMALWAEDSTVKVTYNTTYTLKSNEIVKITVSYKFSGLDSGSAYLYVCEGDEILDEYDLAQYNDTDFAYNVTEDTANSGVSDNGDSEFNNEYGTMEIYVKGSALYNSTFQISLGLGSDDESATGCVLFDDIIIEYATTEEYSEATDVVEFGAISAEASVTNGNFNAVTITEDSELKTPDSWTVTSGNDESSYYGVINTDAKQYASYQESEYEWALTGNPKNPNTNDETPNNILMLNSNATWQTLTSPTISLSADTTYALTFKYKINCDKSTSETALYVNAYTSDENINLFTDEIKAKNQDTWITYTIYFENGSGATDIYLEIGFGSSENTLTGYAYFDNFALATSDVTSGTNFVDMTDFYLNLPTNDITSSLEDTYTSAYSFTVNENLGTVGLVTSDMFKDSNQSELYELFNITDENGKDLTEAEKVFFLQLSGEGSASIKSNFTIDLTADTYYKLTFTVKTYFGNEQTEDEENLEYGLTAGLTGFDYMTDIRTDDGDGETYVTYTMYFCPTEDASVNLYFCLVCQTKTYGTAVVYDVTLTNSDDDDTLEDAYTAAKSAMSADEYDLNTDCVLVAYEDGTDTSDEDVTEESTDEEEASETSYEWMLYTSTIVFGLAIIVAIVGYSLRHVRIKKFKKKEKIDYGRQNTVDMEIIRQKARAQRDEEVAKVQETVDKFQKELDRLEAEHKENVLKLRENDNGKLTKVTDKEFKEFGQKRTVISEKIDALNKQIEDMKSPEYLLTIERKVYELEEAKRKELLKMKKEIEAPTSEADQTAKASKKSKNEKAEDVSEKSVKKAKKSKKTDKPKKTDESKKTHNGDKK